MNTQQTERMKTGLGFIAALDQSGGSTPKALKLYGIDESSYTSEDEMYDIVHQMRTRIIKSPSFNSDHILGAILFENTMDKKIDGVYTADYLWNVKGIVPFLKIDKGLMAEVDGAQLMKPIDNLDAILQRANVRNIFGTKMRSVIHKSNFDSIHKIVEQQFEVARRVLSYGLVPIIEPEVDITIDDKKEAEAILKDALIKHLNTLDDDQHVIFKLSIPTVANLYHDLLDDKHVLRIVALSGGYARDEANSLLSKNEGIIASFSRALSEGLNNSLTDSEFDTLLAQSIQSIYQASIT